MKWTIGLFVIILLFFGGIFGYYIYSQKLQKQNSVSTQTPDQSAQIEPIDTSLDPVQLEPYNADTIIIQGEDGQIFLSPMAEYSVSAKVVGRKNYSGDWQAEFEPTDLALAWGDLAEPGFDEGISYTQSGRWYYYHYDAGYKASPTYIIEHSSNHHIIPANDTIKNAVRKVKEGQKVKIDGYLVNVKYVMSKGEYTQNSSLTRSDSGDGACEVVYVEKLQVEDKVYQ